MAKKVVYQTLEDRGDPNKIEREGPFPCKRASAWLGEGYYFWDTFIENAHWWGITNYPKGYVICKAECEYDESKCFDLVGNTDHIQMFTKTMAIMKEKKLIDKNTTVARVINYLIYDLKYFKFEASRVYGLLSKKINSPYCSPFYFDNFKPQYIDLNPPIQICFYNRKSLDLKNYRIIYPDEYIEGYLI